MKPHAFDTHIHLDLLENLNQQLVEAAHQGIANWVVPGVNKKNWPKIQEMAEKNTGVLFPTMSQLPSSV